MSADLIGDDACREAFNKARQQRFSVHGLDVVCEPDIFRAGYAAGRDSEIAKRDARMAELEKELQAGATAVENCELFRAELAAIKAQEPAFMWHKGATEDESEVVDVDCACPCCVPLYAAPVSEAKAQGVYSTDPLACSGCASGCFRCRDGAKAQGVVMPERETELFNAAYGAAVESGWESVKCMARQIWDAARLNAAPVQQASVPDGWKLVPVNATEAILDVLYSNGMDESDSLLQDIWSAMLYVAPAAPAADAGLVEALEHARLFIVNGIDIGFIQMPEAGTPDPAHETLPMIDAALAAHRAAPAPGGE